ncbi:MAG TPA: hypothetical protein QF644_01990 [Candidatus Poseidoniaceae archaeon]|nr:hypothetical protein [Candidatus Poseidoniaceae archaeon]
MNSIFWTALDIAWSDGSMSKKGALIIEKLNDAMGLKTSLREEIEDEFARVVLEGRTERGEGTGDAKLEIWVNEIIEDLNSDELESQIICLSSKAVKQGLSKEKWVLGMNFTDEFNQSNTFAEGVWMENDSKNEFKEYLSILQPLENDLKSN